MSTCTGCWTTPGRGQQRGREEQDRQRGREEQAGSADLLAELDSLDLDTELADAVVVVEWGEGLAERLSERHLDVRLRYDDDSDVRIATWEWSEMILLALDTATPAVTAGVVRRDEGEHLIAERVTVDARAHAETLTPNVLAALADSGLAMTDLDAVVVGCGPGPFTGLRVGMATAAAFGHALDIPVHGVCSLDAIGVRTSGDVSWSPTPVGARCIGRATATGSAQPALRSMRPPTSVPGRRRRSPGRRSTRRCSPAATGRRLPHTGRAGRAVADWSAGPAPLVPLYLRRPDAKTLAERQAVTR